METRAFYIIVVIQSIQVDFEGKNGLFKMKTINSPGETTAKHVSLGKQRHPLTAADMYKVKSLR